MSVIFFIILLFLFVGMIRLANRESEERYKEWVIETEQYLIENDYKVCIVDAFPYRWEIYYSALGVNNKKMRKFRSLDVVAPGATCEVSISKEPGRVEFKVVDLNREERYEDD